MLFQQLSQLLLPDAVVYPFALMLITMLPMMIAYGILLYNDKARFCIQHGLMLEKYCEAAKICQGAMLCGFSAGRAAPYKLNWTLWCPVKCFLQETGVQQMCLTVQLRS
uniref:Uncharacterized protein n=1 Tax=Glossina palpalis gambiensis TaxID=67801 RepID=A0A1B0AM66_9MUSC